MIILSTYLLAPESPGTRGELYLRRRNTLLATVFFQVYRNTGNHINSVSGFGIYMSGKSATE